MMEPIVLLTGFLFSGAFIVLEQYALAGCFFLLAFITAWLCRRHDERRHW